MPAVVVVEILLVALPFATKKISDEGGENVRGGLIPILVVIILIIVILLLLQNLL
jgi:hypothetical protein